MFVGYLFVFWRRGVRPARAGQGVYFKKLVIRLTALIHFGMLHGGQALDSTRGCVFPIS